MPATSVTGKGKGAANKPTFDEMSVAANGPIIIFTGIVEVTETVMSPPSPSSVIVFPYPLPGGMDQYVVMLTSINAGAVYISDRDEDDDGNFTGFSIASEADGEAMYLVAKVGIRPNS